MRIVAQLFVKGKRKEQVVDSFDLGWRNGSDTTLISWRKPFSLLCQEQACGEAGRILKTTRAGEIK